MFIENQEFLIKIKSNDIKMISEAIGYLIEKNDLNLEENSLEKTIQNLEITNEKTSFNNILKYLMKYSFQFKNEIEFKNSLEENFKEMYSYREISEYFETNKNLSEKIKLFLNKLSYIINFVLLCLSPGDLLKNEMISYNNIKENTIKKELEDSFGNYFNEALKDILNDEIIYYDENIKIHEKDDEFDKFEQKIKENIMKIEEEFNKNSNSTSNEIKEMDFSNEIDEIIDNISNNKINFSNLLEFLYKCKKYLIKIPIILSFKDKQNNCIKATKMIYNFVSSLKNSSIYKTNFKNKIDFFFNEFESFLSGFSCFQIKNENHNYNYNLIKKCELPFNETREIIDRQDNYDPNLISNPEISGYYTQTKPDSENFENENENKNEKTNEHFIDIGKTTQIYDNRFTKKITDKKDLIKDK